MLHSRRGPPRSPLPVASTVFEEPSAAEVYRRRLLNLLLFGVCAAAATMIPSLVVARWQHEHRARGRPMPVVDGAGLASGSPDVDGPAEARAAEASAQRVPDAVGPSTPHVAAAAAPAASAPEAAESSPFSFVWNGRQHGPPPAARSPSENLISEGRPASADVLGNLGPPAVITSSRNEDWLKDRWQAAKDMTGAPIPGAHWVEIDLERRCSVTRVIIDWEKAHATRYTVKGRSAGEAAHAETTTLAVGEKARVEKFTSSKRQHVIHDLEVVRTREIQPAVEFVRVEIDRPATQWGSSIWELRVYGSCEGKPQS